MAEPVDLEALEEGAVVLGARRVKYVNKKMVVAINQLCLDITGGMAASGNGLRDDSGGLGFVEYIFYNEVFGQKLYPTIYHQAAAYMFYIIKNHVFADGNKRTGLACAITFLEWNGVHFDPLPEEPVFDFVTQIAAGENDPDVAIPRIAAWLHLLSEVKSEPDE